MRQTDSFIITVGIENVIPPWRILWQFLIKLNTHLLYDPMIPLLGFKQRNVNLFVMYTIHIQCCFIHNSKK